MLAMVKMLFEKKTVNWT